MIFLLIPIEVNNIMDLSVISPIRLKPKELRSLPDKIIKINENRGMIRDAPS